MSYRFELPIYLTFKYKTKKDKKVPVNLNWFRHAHHRDYDKAKVMYSDYMKEQIESFDPLPTGSKVKVKYYYYAAMNNGPDLDNFVGAAKKFFQDALIDHGFIENDNVNFICENNEKYMGIDRKNPRIVAVIEELE